MVRRPTRSTLFPTRRSSDLRGAGRSEPHDREDLSARQVRARLLEDAFHRLQRSPLHGERGRRQQEDRKSTRLNSSHVEISYAVFCLKKKTDTDHFTHTLVFS